MFDWRILYHISRSPALQRCLNHPVTPLWLWTRRSASFLFSGGVLGTSRPTIAATVARRCPAYDRFTVLWLSILSFSVPRFPRFDYDATLCIDRLKPSLQLDHALHLFRKRQVGKVAAAMRLGVLRFCERAHLRHLASSSSGQASPCATHISAKRFLSNRSESRKDRTRNLSFSLPV